MNAPENHRLASTALFTLFFLPGVLAYSQQAPVRIAIDIQKEAGPMEIDRFGLISLEDIYVCRKGGK